MNQILKKISRLSKSCDEADFLPNMLGRYYTDVISGIIPVVLFGAGSTGMRLGNALKIHHVNITSFCDNNPDIVGDYCIGLPVISVEELRQNHMDSLVVISASSQYAQQIHQQLLCLGFSSDRIHIPPLDPMIYYTNVVKLYWPAEDLRAYTQQLQHAYELFSDTKSKNLFIHRIALFAGAFDYRSFKQFIDNHADLLAAPSENLFTSPRYDENYFYFNLFGLIPRSLLRNLFNW